MCLDTVKKSANFSKDIYSGQILRDAIYGNAPSGPKYKKPPNVEDPVEERRRALERARIQRLRAIGSFGTSDTRVTGSLGLVGQALAGAGTGKSLGGS